MNSNHFDAGEVVGAGGGGGVLKRKKKERKKKSKLGRLLEGGGVLFIHTFFLTSPVFKEDGAFKRVVSFFFLFLFFFSFFFKFFFNV